MKGTKNIPQNFSKTEVKNANPFLLYPLYFGLRVMFFFKGVKIKTVNNCGKIEAPSVVLCNHGSFYDFLYSQIILKKMLPNFITARLYFYNKFVGNLLRSLGCFPKSMFATDLESIKNCLKVLGNGNVLAMMPEARLSTVGLFEDIQENTYSFLKKCNVPVYVVKMNGDYLASPKWGNGLRRGAYVEATLDLLFTKEEIASLSLEQIKERTENALNYNEFLWLKENPKVKYNCKNIAQGLENILTFCPVCGRKHSIYTMGNKIYCETCGLLTSLSNRYEFDEGFKFENIALWYAESKNLVKQEILNNESFALEDEVELRLPSFDGKTQTRFAGNGKCTLTKQGLTYTGTKDNEAYSVSFPLKRVYRLLFGAGENFEIYNGSEILYFVPKDKRTCVDWYIASSLLYDIYVGWVDE